MTEEQPFAGRVALVTGASGGIGRAIAAALAAEGASVGLHYSSSPDPAHRLAERIAAGGGRSAVFGADLSDPDAPAALADRVVEQLGPIELLVNNAGVGRRLTWEQTTIEDFDEAYAVNLRAPFLLTQRVLPTMLDRGFGRILFMSSVAGRTGGIVGPHYASAKSGLHGLTHFLAAQLAASRVTVNALAPALIADTGMLPGTPEELVARIPLGRLGTPDEVADLTLAVLRNAYVTNQVISIDGGMFPGRRATVHRSGPQPVRKLRRYDVGVTPSARAKWARSVAGPPKPLRTATCSIGSSVISSSSWAVRVRCSRQPPPRRHAGLRLKPAHERPRRHARLAGQRGDADRLRQMRQRPPAGRLGAARPGESLASDRAERTAVCPPSRCGAITVRRASFAASAAPWSERITCRQRSRPAATPALVSTSP